MSFEFNKSLLIDNIEYLLKERNKRVGELEAEIGVSAGYISRISKEGGSKPGIDFIAHVAAALNVSIDTLLTVPLTDITPTEKYLISFFEKLIQDTTSDRLDWEKESAKYLNNLEPEPGEDYVRHRLFSIQNVTLMNQSGNPENLECVVFTSDSFGNNTYIADDCFYLQMKNNARLYLMNIALQENYDIPIITNSDVIEVWMWVPNDGAQFICSTDNSLVLATLVENLYQTVYEFSKHPKLKRDLKAVIDAFMVDDFSADDKKSDNAVIEDDDDLPF